jgi:hypothetical protein
MATNLFTTLEKPNKDRYAALYTWQSRERYWTPKDRAWYVMYASFFVLLIAFAAMLQEFVLIIAIVAFVFLWFIQASIPPGILVHSVTKIGLKSYGKLFKWNQIRHFWFSEKHGVKYLHLELSEDLYEALPYKRLTMLCENDEDYQLFDLLIGEVDYGDKDEIGYSFLTSITNGKHIDLKEYMPDSPLFTDEDTLEESEFEEDLEEFSEDSEEDVLTSRRKTS